MSEVLDQNYHADYRRISVTLKDDKNEITKSLKKIDFLARGNVGPQLTLNPGDKTLTLSEIIDKTLLTTLTLHLNMDLTETDLRKKISQSLKNAGVTDEQITKLYDHFSLPTKSNVHLANNTHVLKAMAIPNKEVFNILLQGDNEQTKLKVRNTVAVEQSPQYLALLFRDIRSAVDDDRSFDELIDRFLSSGTPAEPRLKQIFKNVTENAKAYQTMRKSPKTRSVSQYVSTDSYPEVRFSELSLKTVSKKISSETIENLVECDELPGLSYQCFHCCSICPRDSQVGDESTYELDDDFQRVNVFRMQILKTVDEVSKHYANLHTKKKSHQYLLPCLRCITEEKYETCLVCCHSCLKAHFLYLHSASDPFHQISTDLESSFRRDPSVLDAIKSYFDIRCRSCFRLFSTSAKRDLHESRVCLARSISLSYFYGSKLDVTRPITSDFSKSTRAKIELELATKQATLLTEKQLTNEEPFFNSSTTKTGNNDSLLEDPPKSMTEYLSDQTLDLVKKRKKKPSFSFVPRDTKGKDQTGNDGQETNSEEDRDEGEQLNEKKGRKNEERETESERDENEEDKRDEGKRNEDRASKGKKEKENVREGSVEEERGRGGEGVGKRVDSKQEEREKKNRNKEKQEYSRDESDFEKETGESTSGFTNREETPSVRLKVTPRKKPLRRDSKRIKNDFIIDECSVSKSKKQDISSSSSSTEAASENDDYSTDDENNDDGPMKTMLRKLIAKELKGKDSKRKSKRSTLSSGSDTSTKDRIKKKKGGKRK